MIPTVARFFSSEVVEVKCLFWDRQGMCMYVKKLDRGRFVWPQAKDGVVSLTMAQFSMLLESIDWRNTAWTIRPEVVV
jgi:transposase